MQPQLKAVMDLQRSQTLTRANPALFSFESKIVGCRLPASPDVSSLSLQSSSQGTTAEGARAGTNCF